MKAVPDHYQQRAQYCYSGNTGVQYSHTDAEPVRVLSDIIRTYALPPKASQLSNVTGYQRIIR